MKRLTIFSLAFSLLISAALIWTRPARAADFVVTNTADSGAGSLRQAIQDANANPGLDSITFAIPPLGSQQTITLTTSLPTVSDPVFLDGWSQGGTGYAGPPLVELNGENVTTSASRGFRIDSGGTTVRGFIINGFDTSSGSGIWLRIADGNWIYANYIGLDAGGTAAVPNHYGIWVDNWGNTQPSNNNVIGTNGDGVNDALEGNVIAGNLFEEIRVETEGNVIAGNYLGLNAAGTVALSSGGDGVVLFGANNIVGTNGDGLGDDVEGNVIAGNNRGLSINNSNDHTIAGNIIGLDASGSTVLGNTGNGIDCNASATTSRDIVIGSNNDGVSDDLEGNVISGNGSRGFSTFDNNCRHITISRNYIGTDATGTVGLGNQSEGIIISAGDWYTITHNIISHNGQFSMADGINLGNGANNITISGNIIGADSSGTVDLGNTESGIYASSGDNYLIGSDGDGVNDAAEANIIVGNNVNGIYLTSDVTNAHIEGNLIGTQADGTTPLPNSQDGILLLGNAADPVNNHTVQANTIAHNGQNGITLQGTTINNLISANHIFDNDGLGIDLGDDGVTANDGGDGDSGANNLQNYPVLSAVNNLPATVTITGTLDSTANTTFTLEFFRSDACDASGYGEGQVYLGSDTAASDGSGTAIFAATLPALVPGGQYVTATATDPAGNSSEFSLCFGPTAPVPDVPIAGLSAGNDGPVRWGEPVTLFAAADDGTNINYSWDFDDGSLPANGDVVTHTYAVTGTYTATVSASNNGSFAQAATTVTVLPAGTIHGRVWDDADGDSFFGLGEDEYVGATVTVAGVGDFVTGADGRWAAPSLPLGTYTVTIDLPGTYATPRLTQTAYLLQSGFYTVDFPLQTAAAAGAAHLRGRVWSDANGNGLPDRDEIPVAGHMVQITAPEILTTTTDADGLFNFDGLTYSMAARQVSAAAPADHTPATQTATVFLVDGGVVAAHLGFTPQGSIVGQVIGPANTAANRTVSLSGDQLLTTTTDSQGSYRFDDVSGGVYDLTVAPPAGYYMAGPDTRSFTFNGGTQVENWQIVTAGALAIEVDLLNVNGRTPLGGVPVQISNDDGYDQIHYTDPNGLVYLGTAEPATYTARPRTDLMGLGLVSDPVQRVNVVVAPGYGRSVAFTLSGPQALRVICRGFSTNPDTYPGPGFDCGVRVQVPATGATVYSADLSAAAPEQVFGLPASGTYSVTLTMADARFPAWPDYQARIVANASTPLVEVTYPYALNGSVTTIDGYAFLDENGNGQREYEPFLINERNQDVANGLTVELLDMAGNVLATTTTARQNSSNTGYYAFTDLAFGDYQVRFTLPAGAGDIIYAPTTPLVQTATVAASGRGAVIDFGFEPLCGDCISGRVFFDDGDGFFDPAGDEPYAGQTVRLLPPGGPPQTTETDDGGFYRFEAVTPGVSYQVQLVWTAPVDPPTVLTRPAAAGSAALARVDFPVSAVDYLPKAVVFYDTDLTGSYGNGEQTLPGVTLQLYDEYCVFDGTLVETIIYQGGYVTFNTPLPDGGCVRPDLSTVPPGALPFYPDGAIVPPLSNIPVSVALVDDARTLLVQPFWDADGNGERNSDESIRTDLQISVNDTLDAVTGLNGALFNLPAGSYTVALVSQVPGMEVAIPQPATVLLNDSGSVRHEIPLRFSSRINGVVFAQTGVGDTQFNGVTVELRDLAGTLVASTVSAGSRGGLGAFSFGNVPCDTYQLIIPAGSLPTGYRLAEAPVVVNETCAAVQQNVQLVPLGDVNGRIYWDGNFNSQFDPGEGAPTIYDVVLVDEDGNTTTVTPAADGTFLFADLQPGVFYNLTVPDLQELSGSGMPRNSITEAPGWFTVDMATMSLNVGIGPYVPDDDNTEAYGQVYVQTGNTRQPVAGAVVAYAVAGSGPDFCDLDNPSLLGQTTTDVNGDYLLDLVFQPDDDLFYCLLVVDAPGYEQVNAVPAAAAYCYASSGQPEPYCAPTTAWDRDIELAPAGGGRGGDGVINWSAFRDDNVNGAWDAGEQPLPGVTLTVNGVDGLSAVDGSGQVIGVSAGEVTLAVTPPAGYAPVAPLPPVWHTGAPLTMPPLAFRPADLLVGSAFVDHDGDGRQSADEPGVGEVAVSLTGPASANDSSSLTGAFTFAGLPDGTYTLSVTPPAGFAPVSDQTVVVAGGGAVSVPLRPQAQVSGILYRDWDGDGQRGPDEARTTTPISVTLTGFEPVVAHGGSFLFWEVPAGSYTVTPYWDAVVTTTVAAGDGVALPAVNPGFVQGTVWWDGDGDGRRGPGEAPLSGVTVTLTGSGSVVTDRYGRYAFTGVADGAHTVTVSLPTGLVAAPVTVTVGDGRGAAAGIPVTAGSGETNVYLPLLRRPPANTATGAEAAVTPAPAVSGPPSGASLPGGVMPPLWLWAVLLLPGRLGRRR